MTGIVWGFLLLFLFSCPEQQAGSATAWNLPEALRAGTRAPAGSEESDDWNFFDAWQVYMRRKVEQGAGAGRPPVLRGEAIVIERAIRKRASEFEQAA